MGSLEIRGTGAVLLRALHCSFSPAKAELGWPGGDAPSLAASSNGSTRIAEGLGALEELLGLAKGP